jgi:hypothetical protein
LILQVVWEIIITDLYSDKMSKFIRRLHLPLTVTVFMLIFLMAFPPPLLAATITDSYADSSLINTGASSNQTVTGGQLKVSSNTSYGDGADGALTVAANKNINTDLISTGRGVADGINYPVGAGLNTMSSNYVVLSTPMLVYNSTNVAAANAYSYWKTFANSTVLATGDTFEYDVLLASNTTYSGGVDIYFTDATYARSIGWVDQNGLSCQQADLRPYAYTPAWWYHRVCTIPAGMNGKTISYIDLVNENDTATATSTYYGNFTIKNSGGAVKSYVWTSGTPTYNVADILSNAGNTNSMAYNGLTYGGPTPPGLAAGDDVLLINQQGSTSYNSNVGNYEILTISSINFSAIVFTTNITGSYGTTSNADTTGQKIMVQRVPNYTNVTVNSGITLTASAWDGTKGGVVAFKANGTVTNNGTISANALGYTGGIQVWANNGYQGENLVVSAQSTSPANHGGGGGIKGTAGACTAAAGAGGGYGTGGSPSVAVYSCCGASTGGSTIGQTTLSSLYFGGGGGSGGTGTDGNYYPSGPGGRGGGIILITANTLTNSGAITNNGGAGSCGGGALQPGAGGPGGGGAGGSIFFQAGSTTMGSNIITAASGIGNTCNNWYNRAGNGGLGRIALQYVTSYTGTATPSANVSQINAYKTTATIQSTNILSGQYAGAIKSVTYNLSAKPAGTTATIQFSQNASSWYNAVGTLNASNTLTTGTNNILDATPSGWIGPNFYYKIAFGSDGTGTPVLDDIAVRYVGGYKPIASTYSPVSITDDSYFVGVIDGDNPARFVDGAVAGTGNTNTGTITISNGATLTINSDQTIVAGSFIVTNGSIVIATGGVLKPGGMAYAIDADQDFYPASANTLIVKTKGVAAPSGFTRRNNLTSLSVQDCNDNASTGYSLTNSCTGVGGACSADVGCVSGICGTDADGDQLYSAALGHTGTCQANAYAYTDTNDAQYCPANYNPASTCDKCVNGAITYQTSSEDLFSECASGSCATGNCNGTGYACQSSGTYQCDTCCTCCDVAHLTSYTCAGGCPSGCACSGACNAAGTYWNAPYNTCYCTYTATVDSCCSSCNCSCR